MRIHEIGKKHDKTSKEVLAICKSFSIEAKSHMTNLSATDAKKVEKELKGSVKSKAPAKAKAATKTPTKTKKAVSEKETAAPKKKSTPESEDKATKEKVSKATVPAKKKSKKNTSEDIKKRIAEKLHGPNAVKAKPIFKRPQQKFSPKDKKVQVNQSTSTQSPEGRVGVHGKSATNTIVAGKTEIQIRFPITVGALATNMEVKTSELIKALMNEGIFASVNQLLNEEIVQRITQKFNVSLDVLPSEEQKLIFEHEEDDDDPKLLKLRSPVVTLMGHVDHGKTSLLDAIRDSRIVDREAGKITQHMGAYSVPIEGKGRVTFLDTPGHEAFTAMRSRGANVTDVVVLVVAADDGVMPQTIEAINHAKAANVPIVVAINKSDLPTASPDKIKAELQKYDLMSEDWGGKTIMVNVSALKKTGIQELLEMLLLEAEILELKANPEKFAQGIVLEAEVTKSHGTITHALVTGGTMKIGDYLICGSCFGKVRAMHNDLGKNIKEAGPSMPVEIFGVQGIPNAADRFYVVPDEKTARRIADQKTLESRERELNAKLIRHTTLESLFDKIEDGKIQELNILIKADVQGSLEVLQQSLEKISSEKINLKIIHAAVGGINESDVMLAAVSDAIVIGFHVKANMKAQELVDREGIDVRYYNIIYEAIEDLKVAMEGKLAPTYKEVTMGTLEVRETFKASKIGTIGGCHVLKGKVARSHKIRILRDDIVVFEGELGSLKRFKEDAREVKENTECGVTVTKFNDLKVGDKIESFIHEAVASKL